MPRKNCLNCKYGSWSFAFLYPLETKEKCDTCSGIFNNWVRKTDTVKVELETKISCK